MKLNYYEIGNRIRNIREGLNLSQIAFAEILGVGREHVGRIERGPKHPSIELLADISYITGYSMDFILFGADSKVEKKRETARNEMRLLIKRLNDLTEQI